MALLYLQHHNTPMLSAHIQNHRDGRIRHTELRDGPHPRLQLEPTTFKPTQAGTLRLYLHTPLMQPTTGHRCKPLQGTNVIRFTALKQPGIACTALQSTLHLSGRSTPLLLQVAPLQTYVSGLRNEPLLVPTS